VEEADTDSSQWLIISISIQALIVILGVLFLWRRSRELKSGFPLKDERTERIQGRAALRAYYVTVFFLVAETLWIIVGNEFLQMPPPEAYYIIFATMLVLGLTFGFFNWYYGKQGDSP